MKLSRKPNFAAGAVLLLLAAFFSISLIIQSLDFGPGGPGGDNFLFILGEILFSVYGFSSALIPVFLLTAALSCFGSRWTARKSMRLLTAVVPFFTAVGTETVCRAVLTAYPRHFTGLKITIAVLIGIMLVVIEFLGAGIIADRISGKAGRSAGGRSAESGETDGGSENASEASGGENAFAVTDDEKKSEKTETNGASVAAHSSDESAAADKNGGAEASAQDSAYDPFADVFDDRTENLAAVITQEEYAALAEAQQESLYDDTGAEDSQIEELAWPEESQIKAQAGNLEELEAVEESADETGGAAETLQPAPEAGDTAVPSESAPDGISGDGAADCGAEIPDDETAGGDTENYGGGKAGDGENAPYAAPDAAAENAYSAAAYIDSAVQSAQSVKKNGGSFEEAAFAGVAPGAADAADKMTPDGADRVQSAPAYTQDGAEFAPPPPEEPPRAAENPPAGEAAGSFAAQSGADRGAAAATAAGALAPDFFDIDMNEDDTADETRSVSGAEIQGGENLDFLESVAVSDAEMEAAEDGLTAENAAAESPAEDFPQADDPAAASYAPPAALTDAPAPYAAAPGAQTAAHSAPAGQRPSRAAAPYEAAASGFAAAHSAPAEVSGGASARFASDVFADMEEDARRDIARSAAAHGAADRQDSAAAGFPAGSAASANSADASAAPQYGDGTAQDGAERSGLRAPAFGETDRAAQDLTAALTDAPAPYAAAPGAQTAAHSAADGQRPSYAAAASGFAAEPSAPSESASASEDSAPSARAVPKGPYKIPTDLLTAYQDDQYWIIDEDTKSAADALKETLNEFNIEAEIIGIKKGPVVTMFELFPAPGVKLSKIVALQDNIALRLAASSVRIVAPIPGKAAVGIEVPNRKRSIVSFREMIEHDLSEFNSMAIPVVLGKDILGRPQLLDLVKTPHLLIAGATGSGKSVCVNSMILSILYKRSPQKVKMILIDPKIVELKLYNGIPHLLTPVITEPKRAFQSLQYCLCEMERRYALLDSMGVRDIASYNRRVEERHICTETLPYIVVIIDEFADLMATTGKELESTVARLAAMSRAVGIHLVLATQRPSIDVITGLIKANIPSRIAFMVASKMDSRIIIDQVGAEMLLGRGDMLYASSVDPFPVRIQGTFVSDSDVENVVEYVKRYGPPEYIDEEIFVDDEDDGDSEPGLFSDGDDPLYEQALDIVIQAGKASASYIQRRLKIGYNRAARLVEEMEERGIVGPANGSKPREVVHVPG